MYLIKNNANGDPLYKYKVGNLGTLSQTLRTPTTALPLPEEGAEENVLVKVEGNSNSVRINWVVYDNDENQEVLAGATTKTLFEQWNFIEDNMQADGIESSARLQIEDDSSNILKKWDGITGEFTFNLVGNSPVGLVTSFLFQQGTVVSVYDIDVPSKPINLDVDTDTAGEINVSWATPLQNTSDIQGYDISYQLLGGSETIQSVNSSTFSDSLTGLTADDIYNVKVYATTSTVDGQPTATETVVVT